MTMFIKKNQYRRIMIFMLMIIGGAGCTHTPMKFAEDTPIFSRNCSKDTVYFQNSVLPLIKSNCAVSGCHDADRHEHGIQLSDYSSIISTGGVIPYHPNKSKLYTVLSGDEGGEDKKASTVQQSQEDIMPPSPRSPFTLAQKDIIKNWILQGALNNACNAACDTTNVTFSKSVFPIIQTNCISCHSGTSPQGGVYLRNYDDLVSIVKKGKLWGSINQQKGYIAMPPGGSKLSACELSTIRIWIDNGTPNN